MYFDISIFIYQVLIQQLESMPKQELGAMQPVICNVIASCILSSHNSDPIDLKNIAQKVEGSRLNSRKFPGLVIRKSKPKGTLILFKSHKFIVVGCSTIQDCQLLARKLCKDLQKILNSALSLQKFRITNIIANARLGYKINIGYLSQQNYAYKDDKQPGVLLRLRQIKSAIVFSSGKIILNGATKLQDIHCAYNNLVSMLKQFQIKATIYQMRELDKETQDIS